MIIDKIETTGKYSNDFSVGYMLHNVKKARTKPRTDATDNSEGNVLLGQKL